MDMSAYLTNYEWECIQVPDWYNPEDEACEIAATIWSICEAIKEIDKEITTCQV